MDIHPPIGTTRLRVNLPRKKGSRTTSTHVVESKAFYARFFWAFGKD